MTYKCAWRMLTLIRRALRQSEDVLQGIVEVDTGYIGGRRNANGMAAQQSHGFRGYPPENL